MHELEMGFGVIYRKVSSDESHHASLKAKRRTYLYTSSTRKMIFAMHIHIPQEEPQKQTPNMPSVLMDMTRKGFIQI